MDGASSISSNVADVGGGIFCSYGTISMKGNSSIQNNTAKTSYGGGIQAQSRSQLIFDGKGIAIKNNKAHFPSMWIDWYHS